MKLSRSSTLLLAFGISLGLGACGGKNKKSSLNQQQQAQQQQQQQQQQTQKPGEEYVKCSPELLDQIATLTQSSEALASQAEQAKGDKAKLEQLLNEGVLEEGERITDFENEHGDTICYVKEPKSNKLFEKNVKLIASNFRVQLELISIKINQFLKEITGAGQQTQEGQMGPNY